ncbi:MAG: methionine gamma-lyase family protein, partial [Clostridia bacterium]
AQALKTATLAAAIFDSLGMKTTPALGEARTDIIQALELGTPEHLIAFCEGIQLASPIDSMAVPEPWAMPGYQHQVIMAAGTFVSGASIELSADAPMREPYTVFLQGGLTYSHGKLALARTLAHMQKKGCL